MGDNSTIEWTDATWNPVRGCSIVSKGCTNCYAMRQAHRSSGEGAAYAGLTKATRGGPVWTGAIRLVPELLNQPLRWKRPRRIFVNSMSDLFHEAVPDEFILQVFDVMRQCENGWTGRIGGDGGTLVASHTFQILTKRSARMLDFCARLRFAQNDGRGLYLASDLSHNGFNPMSALRHVWLGVSVEDQAAADERIPLLLQTPAAVRWISAEPLLGPIDLHDVATLAPDHIERHAWRLLDWVVAGGESGPGARPMHPDWARNLRDQCSEFGIAFFFKQWGAFRIGEFDRHHDVSIRWQDGAREWYGDGADIKYSESWLDDKVIAWPASKKSTGRLLDGRTHDEYPAA
jgi:protein gp37